MLLDTSSPLTLEAAALSLVNQREEKIKRQSEAVEDLLRVLAVRSDELRMAQIDITRLKRQNQTLVKEHTRLVKAFLTIQRAVAKFDKAK